MRSNSRRSSGADWPQRASRVFWLHMRIRYLCGQGRAVRAGDDGVRVGGSEGATSPSAGVEVPFVVDVGVEVCVDMLRACMGELLVGPGFTYLVMSSGVFAGVTLSMNCQAGRSRTMEEWSEWFGTGMSEAESISFYTDCQSSMPYLKLL